jgi:hypothetical protein
LVLSEKQDTSIVVQHPSLIHFDDRNRLHAVDGPAVSWPDGYSVYSVGGIGVSKAVATRQFGIAEIDAEQNAELRRTMISMYNNGDTGKYLRDSGAKVAHEDTDALGLPRRLLVREVSGDESIVAIELHNSTPEPDGTRKVYTLRCHPELRPLPVPGVREALGDPQEFTCMNAVASTFGMTGQEYLLSIET